MDMAFQMLKEAVGKAATDIYFNIREPGVTAGYIAKEYLTKCGAHTNEKDNFLKYIFGAFHAQLNCMNTTISFNEKLFSNFYCMCVDDGTFNSWQAMLQSLDIIAKSYHSFTLYNFVMDKVFKGCLEYRNKKIFPQVAVSHDYTLDKSEEETLRYVAGYIIHSLNKSILSKRTPEGKATSEILNYWGFKKDEEQEKCEESFLEYTERWVNAVNRGGVLNVTDEFYVFIRRLENVARVIFNKDFLICYCNENLRELLLKAFSESRLINSAWSVLTRHVANKDQAEKLKHKIYSKCINVRAYAFVKAWIQLMKRKMSKVKGGSKVLKREALRKRLSSKK